MGSGEGLSDLVGRGEQRTEVLPDHLIKLMGRGKPSRAEGVAPADDRVTLPATDVVIVSRMDRAAKATRLADTAAHQGAQQVTVPGVVTPAEGLILREFSLRPLKQFGIDQRRNGRQRHPFF
ncbi:MAG: hypothetical protein NVV74_09005 [Magnetospirillum sp.]|nr:hypothetical protein [Magnetospirillum sp.]